MLLLLIGIEDENDDDADVDVDDGALDFSIANLSSQLAISALVISA